MPSTKQLRYLTVASISLLFSASGIAQESMKQPDDCMQLFAKLFGNSPDSRVEPRVELTRSELSRVLRERVCIKSYPWPKGKFLADDAETGAKGVTADEFRGIHKRTEELISRYLANDPLITADAKKWMADYKATGGSLQEVTLIAGLREGADAEQIRLYSDTLLTLLLLKEGRTKEAISLVDQVEKVRALKPLPRSLDQAEEATYYAKETLGNILLSARLRAYLESEELQDKEVFRFAIQYFDNAVAFEGVSEITGLDQDAVLVAVADATDALSLESSSLERSRAIVSANGVKAAWSQAEGATSYVLLEGRHVYAVRISDVGPELVSGEVAAAALTQHTGAEIAARSTNDLKYFNVARLSSNANKFSECVFQLPGKTIRLDPAELETIIAGRPLAKDHDLSQVLLSRSDEAFILYTNPLMEKGGAAATDVDAVVFGLRDAYPGTRIVRDPPGRDTSDKIKTLYSFRPKAVGEVVAATPAAGWEVTDAKLIQSMRDDLLAQGWDVPRIEFQEVPAWQGERGKLVMVITGHIDSKTAAFVRALGTQGWFNDNYVMLNTCEFGSSSPAADTTAKADPTMARNLINEIVSEYGGLAAWGYEGKIKDHQLDALLEELAKRIPEAKTSLPVIIDELVRKAGLRGIWTFCRMQTSGTTAVTKMAGSNESPVA